MYSPKLTALLSARARPSRSCVSPKRIGRCSVSFSGTGGVLRAVLGVQLEQRLTFRPAGFLDTAVGHFRDRCLGEADQFGDLVLSQPTIEQVFDD